MALGPRIVLQMKGWILLKEQNSLFGAVFFEEPASEIII